MAQAPRRSDAARSGNDSMEERLHDVAESGRATVRESGERLLAVAEAEESALGLWLDTGRDQLRHNLETWQSLGSVRDVRGLIELQTEYVRLSLSRLAQLMAKQAELSVGLVGLSGGQTGRNA